MPRSLDVVSQWHHSVEKLTTSAPEFYESISKALSERAAPVQIEKIEWPEGGILSAKRSYLRLTYNRFTFDICAFPFGKDYYFSWWMGKQLPENVLLFGCGIAIGLPIVLVILISAAGLVAGTMIFLVVVGAIFAAVMSNAGGGNNPLEDVLLSIPILGPLYQRFFRPTTYYTEDSRVMFEETVHRVVTDVVAGILAINEMPPLSPEEKKPKTHKSVL